MALEEPKEMDSMEMKNRWYTVDGRSARLFRIGEWLESGSTLGLSCFDGQPVLVEESGHLVEVQYDAWQDRLFLALKAKVDQIECKKRHRGMVLMIF